MYSSNFPSKKKKKERKSKLNWHIYVKRERYSNYNRNWRFSIKFFKDLLLIIHVGKKKYNSDSNTNLNKTYIWGNIYKTYPYIILIY